MRAIDDVELIGRLLMSSMGHAGCRCPLDDMRPGG
jgi:hypothetical protein